LKKAFERPAARAAVLTLIEKAGDFWIKMDKVERAKRRKGRVLSRDAESKLIDKQLGHLKEINEQLEEIAQLDKLSERTIDVLRKCLKRFCPRASFPKITLASVPKTKFGLAMPVLIKRLNTSLFKLSDLASGVRVVSKPSVKNPVVKKPKATPEQVRRAAEIDAEVKLLRGKKSVAFGKYRDIDERWKDGKMERWKDGKMKNRRTSKPI